MEGDAKMKSREQRQRANRRKKATEARLDKCNAYGVKDLTAYNAVERIRTGSRATIILK